MLYFAVCTFKTTVIGEDVPGFWAHNSRGLRTLLYNVCYRPTRRGKFMGDRQRDKWHATLEIIKIAHSSSSLCADSPTTTAGWAIYSRKIDLGCCLKAWRST